MLKTEKEGKMWLVTQPDHAELAGYLAAYWGNTEFMAPGSFAAVPDPERMRAEIVLAVAQHDNGWWEWEATPELGAVDGFPSGLADVLKNQQEGMKRWQLGLRRFDNVPYANLLISYHAYWLYAAKIVSQPDPAFIHPLFWKESPEPLLPGNREAVEDFMAEIKQLQAQWIEALSADAETASWVQPDNLNPHARLLQLLDGLSLALCSALIPSRSGENRGLGEDAFELRNVPRGSWEDRVSIDVTPALNRRIVLNPYPFGLNPLPVRVPARIFDLPVNRSGQFQTWWHAKPIEFLEFEVCSAA